MSGEAEIQPWRNSTSTKPHERQDARETQGGGGSGGGGGEDCIAPSNIAEVASAREIENGSLRLSLFPSTLLSLSLSLSLSIARPSLVIRLASRRLIIAN